MKHSNLIRFALIGLAMSSAPAFGEEQAPAPAAQPAPAAPAPASQPKEQGWTRSSVGVKFESSSSRTLNQDPVSSTALGVRAERYSLLHDTSSGNIREQEAKLDVSRVKDESNGKIYQKGGSARFGYGIVGSRLGRLPCQLYGMATATGELRLARRAHVESSEQGIGELELSGGGEGGLTCSIQGVLAKFGTSIGARYADTFHEQDRLGVDWRLRANATALDHFDVSVEQALRPGESRFLASTKVHADIKGGVRLMAGLELEHASVTNDAMKSYAQAARDAGIDSKDDQAVTRGSVTVGVAY